MENLKISEGWFQSTSFYNTNMSNGNFNSITFVDLNFTETGIQLERPRQYWLALPNYTNLSDLNTTSFSSKILFWVEDKFVYGLT